MSDHGDVADTVRKQIVNCLAVDEEDVTPEANFFEDLGGESLDVLDLGFQLEHEYGIKLHFQQMNAADKSVINEHGCLTEAGLERFRERYPFADIPEAWLAEGVSPRNLFTVAFITQAVEQALAEKHTVKARPVDGA